MSTTILEHPGAFRFHPVSALWTWSEAVFEIYGFTPGDVVPTTELVLSHQHPDDRAEVRQFLDTAVASGLPSAIWHRLVDARGTTRQVVTLVRAECAPDGSVTALTGETLDVHEATRRTVSGEVEAALAQMSQSRPLIEQAKGALMLRYGVDADRAFGLLRRYSQLVNLKVRDLASTLVDSAATSTPWPGDLDQLVTSTRAHDVSPRSARSARARLARTPEQPLPPRLDRGPVGDAENPGA